MKRFFNVTSFRNPEKHCMIGPLYGLNQIIFDLVRNEYYFTIPAPRKTGAADGLGSADQMGYYTFEVQGATKPFYVFEM